MFILSFNSDTSVTNSMHWLWGTRTGWLHMTASFCTGESPTQADMSIQVYTQVWIMLTGGRKFNVMADILTVFLQRALSVLGSDWNLPLSLLLLLFRHCALRFLVIAPCFEDSLSPILKTSTVISPTALSLTCRESAVIVTLIIPHKTVRGWKTETN